jgi:malate dehydrogenase (oxaloacetate-decarboxylating)
VENLRVVSAAAAIAVARAAEQDGVATAPVDEPVRRVHQAMWRPQYPRIELI